MCCAEVVQRRSDLCGIEGRIERDEDCAYFEQGICDRCKLDVVAQMYTNAVSFLHTHTL